MDFQDSDFSNTDFNDTDWQDTLISLYLYICDCYPRQLSAVVQRMSNNSNPPFTDEEVLALYLFGIIKKKRTIRDIYDYVQDHLLEWFPKLPSYKGYVYRLNRLSEVFPLLTEQILEQRERAGVVENVRIVDSIPVIMAKEKRSSQAKVAPEFADKGYCSSKNMYFYGAKVHLVGLRRPSAMPLPEYISLTPGSENDLTALRQLLPHLHDTELYGDKIYADGPMTKALAEEQNLGLFTPTKKKKGQKKLPMTDRAYSEAVSRVRQPIESLFNWIEEKTGIQTASKVRSFQGLMVHVFGRIAAAMLLLAFYS